MMDNVIWKDKNFAEQYMMHWREGMPMANQQRDLIIFLIEQLSPTITKVLDIGCGGGFIGQAILQRYNTIAMVAVDFSEPMITLAQTRLEPFKQRVHFVQQDINNSQWTNNLSSYTPFDVIIASYVIHYVPDHRKKEVYQEIYKLLAPGGLLLILEHVAAPSKYLEQLHHEYFISSLYRYYSMLNITITREEIATQYYHRPQQRANLLTPVEHHLTWLQEIGFIEVERYHQIFQFSLFGGRKPLS